MKSKMKRILACFVIMLSCCIGLCACSVDEVKENTRAGVEASTSVVAIEYSQQLAKDLFANVVGNMSKHSYSMKDEYTYYDARHYITKYQTLTTYTYNKEDSTIFVSEYYGEVVEGSNVNYFSKNIVAKLKDTTNETEEYYLIENYSSDEENSDIVKTFKLRDEYEGIGVGPAGFLHLIPSITSGMCYTDGYSYINVEFEQSNKKQIGSFKIKDGLLLEATVFMVDSTTSSLSIYEKITFDYDNLPETSEIPETIQELISDGYIEGNASEIISERFQ